MTNVTAAFGKPFAFQVAAFRLRLAELKATTSWKDVWQAEHDRAFMVAGAVKADVLADLAAAVDKAISQGTTLEEFRRDFRKIVAEKGWQISPAGQGTKKGEAWRTKVIYRTNVATSYHAGRFAQLTAAKFPYWIYFHGNSSEPRLQHLAWDGLILPADHPFWATHYPPNGWGCSCYVSGARSLKSAAILGGKPDLKLPDNWQSIDPRTGAPIGVSKGWAYAPGATVAEDVAKIVARKLPDLPPQIGADMVAKLADQVDRGWEDWVDMALEGKATGPGLAGALSQDVIETLTSAGLAPASAEIMVKPGLLSGPKAARHAGAGDVIADAVWRNLPAMLRAPELVALDKKTGRLIFVLTEPGERRSQFALALDYRLKVDRNTKTTNVILSAYRPKAADIAARIAGGLLQVLLGALL